jgi:hypothetical protein
MARLKRKLRPEETRDPIESMLADLSYSFAGKVNELIELNVQDVAVIREIEQREMFSAGQSPDFCSAWNPDRERHIIAGLCSSELARDFEVAARWHEWRKRPELAARYQQRAFRCNEILSELEASHHERPNKASA